MWDCKPPPRPKDQTALLVPEETIGLREELNHVGIEELQSKWNLILGGQEMTCPPRCIPLMRWKQSPVEILELESLGVVQEVERLQPTCTGRHGHTGRIDGQCNRGK